MDPDNSKKRTRDELDVSSSDVPESKLARVDLEANSPDLERDRGELGWGRVDLENSGVNSPEAKRIQDDLLNIFDDSDEPAIQGLESVIRSFEEEILVGAPTPEMTSHSGGSQPDLGYLLEASDDELGLPPTFASGVEEKAAAAAVVSVEEGPGTVGFGRMLGFEDGIPNYDSFEFGLGGNPDGNHNYSDHSNGDFVALGRLFDYSDDNFVQDDISGLQWQSESLSAL